MLSDDGVEIPIVFKAHAQSRRITLKRNLIDPPTIIYPSSITQQAALKQIKPHPAYAKLREQMLRPVENAIVNGYRTRLHTFEFHVNQAENKFVAYESGDFVKVYIPAGEDVGSHEVQRFLFKVLKSILRAESERIVPALVAQRARELGLSYRSVAVKPMTTAWGKCSNDGRLLFSAALLLYPDQYVRLVVDHELAHLTHFQHSDAFWTLLSSYRGCDARQEDREMNAYKLRIPTVY